MTGAASQHAATVPTMTGLLTRLIGLLIYRRRPPRGPQRFEAPSRRQHGNVW